MEITKQNGDIAFIESTHKYVNVRYPERKYISVTTLIGNFHPKFDTYFWSSYKALEAIVPNFKGHPIQSVMLRSKKFTTAYLDTLGVSEDEFEHARGTIVAAWDKNTEEACERGTLYHNTQEQKGYDVRVHFAGPEVYMPQIDGVFECVKNDYSLNREQALYQEYLLNWSSEDGILNIAGQADKIWKDGNNIYIQDYKTNVKGITYKSYFDTRTKKSDKMSYPLAALDDCNYNHYALQLSLYAWMLQQINPAFVIKPMYLIHIDADFKETPHEVPYLKDEVVAMLKAYKKQLIVEHSRATGRLLTDEQ